MIKSIQLTNSFVAIPYLRTSDLWQSAGDKISFALDKPNVIVGPNGSGKSALLTLMSLQTLTHFTGFTALDDNYTSGRDADRFWSERTWQNDPEYLPGAMFETDRAPAVYYRPNHLAGNEKCVVTAMMVGYGDESRQFADAVEDKSSGQGCNALLERVRLSLKAAPTEFAYKTVNWSGGDKPVDLSGQKWTGPWEYRGEILKARRAGYAGKGIPMIIMDEPEQSLDTRTELELWRSIQAADCSTRQVVIATHSLYPFMHPDEFNIIEAVPGYLAKVQEMLR